MARDVVKFPRYFLMGMSFPRKRVRCRWKWVIYLDFPQHELLHWTALWCEENGAGPDVPETWSSFRGSEVPPGSKRMKVSNVKHSNLLHNPLSPYSTYVLYTPHLIVWRLSQVPNAYHLLYITKSLSLLRILVFSILLNFYFITMVLDPSHDLLSCDSWWHYSYYASYLSSHSSLISLLCY